MERKFNYHPEAKNKFSYANEQENVTFREYGRNIQNMARHLLTIEDREKRGRMAITLVELMKQLNPVVGEPNDYYQKLWDHLHVMTEMKLDVETPFPKPDDEVLVKKPRTRLRQILSYESGLCNACGGPIDGFSVDDLCPHCGLVIELED